MKGAASFSMMLAAWMVVFITWRRRNKNDDDIKHEDCLEKFNEDHAGQIKARCMKLREEVKNRFADMGIKLDGSYDCGIVENSFAEMIDLEASMLYDPDMDSTDFKKELEENGCFVFNYPLPAEKYVMQAFKAKQMTEEEIMQRECLKRMGIEQ